MAIDAIKKITVVCPDSSSRRLIRAIHDLGVVEVIDAGEQLESAKEALRYPDVPTEEADEKLRKIDLILNLLDVFAPVQQGFFEGLTPLPTVIEHDEINKAIQSFDLTKEAKDASELDDLYRRADRAINEAQNQLRDLTPLDNLPFNISDLAVPKRIKLLVGRMPRRNLDVLDSSVEPWSLAAWEIIKPGYLLRKDIPADELARAEQELARAEHVDVAFAVLKDDEEKLRKGLPGIEFEELTLPPLRGKVRDQIRELKEDLAEWQEELAGVAEKVKKMAEHRRILTILKAFWTATRNRRIALSQGLHGKWVHVLCGYIRAKDLSSVESLLQRDFKQAVLVVNDPAPGEDVPVSLSLPYMARPIRLLVEMFGLPNYSSFDPSPFILINFYIFFGICFSDVGYGLLLIMLSMYLAKKTKAYAGVHDFSRIFFYSGLSTVVFGALMGSWFGDLYKPEYLGDNNLLLRIQEKFAVLDPMSKTIEALVLALGIGMLNQFYGIILKMYGAMRARDWKTAVFDGLLWLITLPGMIILISKMLIATPPTVFRIGLWMFSIGAVGLVLTQGRDAKNPVARLLTGVVSLYGIVGSYGCTAFIGDTLSYCRLLALGLTTGIVAMSFNMMANMLREVPYVGIFLFIAMLIVGHVFNFAISVLGAFVHAMRLIFVEFFGRFYEGGARPFRPLGFDSPLCVVRRPGGAR